MWSCDNPIFNVNGTGLERLKATLTLALESIKIEGFKFDTKHGLILFDNVGPSRTDVTKFPIPLSVDQVAPIVMEWLDSKQADSVPCEGWDRDADHDGHNKRGWRVYTGEWGKVDEESSSCIAIKPAYIWYGK